MNKIILTGGAGFIGSHLAKLLIKENYHIHIIDSLTYAANYESIKTLESSDNFSFSKIDISKYDKIKDIFYNFKPDAVFHLAAESHVDNSILNPGLFIQTNVLGTYNLLNASFDYFKSKKCNNFRFIHISTDEVYGSLNLEDKSFTEKSRYLPNSPYSASKASSDHLVRAWMKTYGLPTIITNCSNNYGPFQHPEKFIPVIILRALSQKKIPIYGDGLQIRDWLHVQDHVEALYQVLLKGKLGDTYNIGGKNELRNIDLARDICSILSDILPLKNTTKSNYHNLINFVKDRPGHDKRYAISSEKITKELGWEAKIPFEDGIRSTVKWYLTNQDWCNYFRKKQ